MLFTVSTLLDSPVNVRFFVNANLASGVDHMVIFLDRPRQPEQKEVAAFLDDQPQVTCVRTGRKNWWLDGRPRGLNVRQRINANWTRELLAPFEWAEWLFHIDGDEVARLDPQAVAEVPEGADAIWLPPLEAVSELHPTGRPTRFKRLLDRDDLTLLHVLGAIDAPTNKTYFHGHVMGKSGVRPRSGLALTLHDAVSREGASRERHQDERLQVLHYDAVSGEEFIRKWSALARAGHARYRASRAPTARALRSLATREMAEDVRERYFQRIYDLTTRDDVDLLGDLGMLVDVDPARDPAEPQPPPAGALDDLAARVEELQSRPKRPYYVADSPPDRAPRRAATRAGRLRSLVKRA